MRYRMRLAQLALIVLSAALGAHLLMHVQGSGHLPRPSAAEHLVAGQDDGHGDQRGHLMAALCMADLTAAPAAPDLAPQGGHHKQVPATSDIGTPLAEGRDTEARHPSRVEAGVVLLV
jgi:hypothetical protein